jgi:DNA-binding transcriptional regulator YiaG
MTSDQPPEKENPNMSIIKCTECGAAMTTKRESVPYEALPGTVLVGVEVSRCPNGHHEVSIPAIDELNRMLAMDVIQTTRRLNGGEIRFLRTYLGYSSGDFAELIKTDAATVSRWEGGKQDIGNHADLLLRALVVLDKRVDEYPVAKFADIGGEPTETKKPTPRAFAPAPKSKWKATELRA